MRGWARHLEDVRRREVAEGRALHGHERVDRHLPRCRRDAGEMQARCRRDAGEMQARCRRDIGEIQARCRRDVGEIYGEIYGEM